MKCKRRCVSIESHRKQDVSLVIVDAAAAGSCLFDSSTWNALRNSKIPQRVSQTGYHFHLPPCTQSPFLSASATHQTKKQRNKKKRSDQLQELIALAHSLVPHHRDHRLPIGSMHHNSQHKNYGITTRTPQIEIQNPIEFEARISFNRGNSMALPCRHHYHRHHHHRPRRRHLTTAKK